MTAWIAALVLLAVAAAGVAVPFLRPARRTAAAAAAGIADGWQEEKERLVAQLRDNDLALAEGRIGATDHAEIAAALAEEAEAAVSRLREARGRRAGDDAPAAAPPRHARWLAVPLALAVVAGGVWVHGIASRGDLDFTVSPHADGRILLPADMAASASPPTAEAAPDIGAMVARLEERLREGEPVPEDLAMLERSYAVMGREAELAGVYQALMARFPERVDYRLLYVRRAIDAPGFAPGEAVGRAVEEIILREPGNLEAHWYRGLLLARLGHFGPARAELEWLLPQLAGNPQADEAVRMLLAALPEPEQ